MVVDGYLATSMMTKACEMGLFPSLHALCPIFDMQNQLLRLLPFSHTGRSSFF